MAIDLTDSPLRAITRISTALSWVNIDGTKKAVILTQVGHFYFGAVGRYYFGGNKRLKPMLFWLATITLAGGQDS